MDNLVGKVLFVVDYRSPSSGCGVIERSDKSLFLLQHAGCKSEVLEGAYDGVFCMILS